MYEYHDARDDEAFEYGVVTYLDGEEEAVTTEGYVRAETMDGTDEPVVVAVDPDEMVRIPFGRVVKIRHESEE